MDPSMYCPDVTQKIIYSNLALRIDRVSRISTIFYMGLEGVGGLEMETDEDENVRTRAALQS